MNPTDRLTAVRTRQTVGVKHADTVDRDAAYSSTSVTVVPSRDAAGANAIAAAIGYRLPERD
jgi:hypothetical protein